MDLEESSRANSSSCSSSYDDKYPPKQKRTEVSSSSEPDRRNFSRGSESSIEPNISGSIEMDQARDGLQETAVPEFIDISEIDRRPKRDRTSTPKQVPGELTSMLTFSMTNCPDDDSSYVSESHSSMGSEVSDQSDNEQDSDNDAVIDKIIARRIDTLNNWKKRCEVMNTSEIECGSLWHGDFNHRNMIADSDGDMKEERFLVKWVDSAYIHCSWELKEVLLEKTVNGKSQLESFERRFGETGYRFDVGERGLGEFFNPLFVQIGRIMHIHNANGFSYKGAVHPPLILDKKHPDYESGSGHLFLITWENTSYSESTYEHERDLVMMGVDYLSHLDAFWKRSKKPDSKAIKKDLMKHNRSFNRLKRIFRPTNYVNAQNLVMYSSYTKEVQAKVFRNGGQLRDYQAEGVCWLLGNHVNRRSSILADEMGLGKTIQTAAFLDILSTDLGVRGPFLIIAPLSTISQWHRELSNWTNLNVIMYSGNALDRAMAREFEFAFKLDRPKQLRGKQKYLKNCHPAASSGAKLWMMQAVITSPEILLCKDSDELFAVHWEMLVIDEAHNRLKNKSSKFSQFVRDERFLFRHCLLLTGTPVQNNIDELWTLLNTVDPTVFGDNRKFVERYGNMQGKHRIDELNDIIRPYILRRLKEDVEKDLPSKEETIIEVELTSIQKRLYRAIYEKNYKYLHSNKGSAHHITNMIMELRKCCNHPFLLEGVEEKAMSEIARNMESDELNLLIRSSGKLVLLDKLLPKLQKGGHRVLIFSQFRMMLDIIEDYLVLRDFTYERIDGSVQRNNRDMAIDRFQDSTRSTFIMLLTTRAGGEGINLTAADTCIIYDSDWNPQKDLQAQARCHRIGQTKKVRVYRFLTRKTYETQLFHLGSLKMGLDQAILQGVESKREEVLTEQEAERLLRYGVYDVLEEDKSGNNGMSESERFIEEDIETILFRRSTTVQDITSVSKNRFNFTKATFKASESDFLSSDECPDHNIDVDDPDFWKKISKAATSPLGVLESASNKELRQCSTAKYPLSVVKSANIEELRKDSDGTFQVSDDTDSGNKDCNTIFANKNAKTSLLTSKRQTRSMSKKNINTMTESRASYKQRKCNIHTNSGSNISTHGTTVNRKHCGNLSATGEEFTLHHKLNDNINPTKKNTASRLNQVMNMASPNGHIKKISVRLPSKEVNSVENGKLFSRTANDGKVVEKYGSDLFKKTRKLTNETKLPHNLSKEQIEHLAKQGISPNSDKPNKKNSNRIKFDCDIPKSSWVFFGSSVKDINLKNEVKTWHKRRRSQDRKRKMEYTSVFETMFLDPEEPVRPTKDA